MGVAILSINRNSAFSITCCPNPSLLSLRELFQSHREGSISAVLPAPVHTRKQVFPDSKQALRRVYNLALPPLRSGGGSGRGCEKPRSDGIPNELQIANSQGVWRRSRHARGEKRETRACLRHTSCEPVYDLLTVSRHRRKNVASPGWCAEAHPMADFGCRGGGAACVGWGLPHRRTTMPGAVYGGFGRCL